MKKAALSAVLFLLGFMIRAGDYLEHMDISVEAYPAQEMMLVEAIMRFNDTVSGKRIYMTMTKPASTGGCVNADDGGKIDFRIHPIPEEYLQYGAAALELNLPEFRDTLEVALSYEYDRQSFTGYGMNPSTWDNLYFGQITEDSIFSSHLYYYPFPTGGEVLESAELAITVPEGWTAVSSGRLYLTTTLGDRTTYHFDCGFPSSILEYPLAVYPYESIGTTYAGRFPVTVFFAPQDRRFAEQRLKILTENILPFHEELMGPYPFPELKVVEVFPHSGNTGLAAKSLVMLSQKIWFADEIDDVRSSSGAVVLVDETAHQWNFYKIQLPNYLAEAVSQYTDFLYTEKFLGREATEKSIAAMRASYTKIAGSIQKVHDLRESGFSREEIIEKTGESPPVVDAYWPFTEKGEVPITDPGIFYTLYFLKGAAALHALRVRLGDDVFFNGFRNVFMEHAAGTEVSLDEFRKTFEKAGRPGLEDFFQLWYYGIGMPE